jgi:hypothetical protein
LLSLWFLDIAHRTPIDTDLVPALVADAGEPAAWRILHPEYPQPEHAPGFLRPILRLVRGSRADADHDPAV